MLDGKQIREKDVINVFFGKLGNMTIYQLDRIAGFIKCILLPSADCFFIGRIRQNNVKAQLFKYCIEHRKHSICKQSSRNTDCLFIFINGIVIAEPLRNFFSLSQSDELRELKQLLELTELPQDILDRYPHELSGGQQRRVCIARAISIKPEYLILDEAVSGIDATVTKGILGLLKKLQHEIGCGSLFITHDLKIALYMAKKVLVMRDGMIMESVSNAKSYRDFSMPYSKRLFKSSMLEYAD